MANTSIKIKRSTTTSSPASLAAGELAYSYLSNTIFIGSPAGTGVLNVGGQYYTSQVDSATDLNTGGTLVRRDPTGNVSFNNITANAINGTVVGSLTGNANSATQLQTARDFSISGGDISASAVSFNGTQNVTLNASLNSIAGLSAGVYGGATAIPVVTVAANGRVMAISNTSISTSFGIAGDTGTDTVNGGDTMYFVGGDGITTAVTNNTISYAVDTTVFRSNTAIAKQTVDGDVEISGNLIVLGVSTTVNVATLSVEDSLIALARNNTTDAVDIGFYGHYNDGTNKHAGVYRHAGTQEFYVFDNYTQEPAANTINPAANGFRVATLNANLKSQFANVTTVSVGTINASSANLTSLTLGTALSVPNGGTGAASFTNGSIIVGSGTGALATLANSNYSATGSGASNNTVSSLTVDAYGRLTAATFEAISGLTVGQGGTGVSSFTAGQIVVGDGSNGLKQIANTTYTQTGTLTTANTISSISVDAYGRLTALTSSAINIDANQITGGTLTVTRGGTGASSFTSGALLVGNGSGAISELANSTYTATGSAGAAKTITSLTVDAYGRVTAATFSDISGLTVSQGGTGASTFSTNGIVYGNGTGAMQVTAAAGTSDQTWSNQILTVTNAGVPVWSSALDGGQF
jgi:hypothetical protein